MDHVTTARNEIEPLLTQLIHQLGIEGRATERAVYSRIQGYLRTATHNHELARPFSDLSTTASVCFTLPGEANILLHRIIEKAEILVRDMEIRVDAIH
ncbi:MAG: hypothetical protein VB933_09215 [Pseudomonadales bacterium]